MKKTKLDLLMKFPMIFGLFVARYIRPIIEVKLPFKLDIISALGIVGFGISFSISLIYLIYSIIKYKKGKK